MFQKALEFATQAHAGQTDKGGRDYIEHPIAVAGMVGSDHEKAVALLHDVIEDTEYTADDLLAAGFPPHVVDIVLMLTKSKGADYFEYLKKVKQNECAKNVKIADLTHNSDLRRIPHPAEKDFERAEKYRKAIQYLTT